LPSHWSTEQGLLSSVQAVPLVFLASVGQVLLVPLQVSVRSHSSAAPRHTVPLGSTTSVGQLALEPVQLSAISHPPGTALRHTVLDGKKPSAGHVVVVPVQVSATSQTPAVDRHTAPAWPAGC